MKDMGFGKSDKQLADAFGVSVSEIKKIKKQIASQVTKPAPKKQAPKPTAKPVTKPTVKPKAPGKKKVEVMPDKINPFKMTPAQKARYLKNPERYDY
jgi:transposase